MKDIYQLAFKAIVWLGAEDEDIFKAFTALQNVSHDETLLDTERSKRDVGRIFNYSKLKDAILKYPPPGWLLPAFFKIMQHAVFRRVWIHQELVVSQDAILLSGSPTKTLDVSACELGNVSMVAGATVEWSNELANLKVSGKITTGEWIDRRAETGMGFIVPYIFSLRWVYRKENNPIPLRRVLMYVKYNHSEATDGRDMIFGLLGIIPRHESILPNYSLTIQQVYISVTELLLNQGFLRVLWSCSHPKTTEHLPSWVPDFASKWESAHSVYFGASGITDEDIKGDMLFHAATAIPPSVSFKTVVDARLLTMKGFIYDLVAKTIPETFQTPVSSLESKEETFVTQFIYDTYFLISMMQMFVGSWPGLGEASPSDEDVALIGRLLFMDRDFSGARVGRLSQRSTVMAEHVRFLRRRLEREPIAVDDSVMALDARMSWVGRTLFSTKQGRVGNGPVKMKEGDLVVVVNGAELPFVLRRLEGEGQEERYELIGMAYMDDIMDGEVLSGGLESSTFDIC
jgi:hypothetical protein